MPAPLAVQQELHAGEPSLELSDAGDGADGVEHLGGDILDVLPLRDREDQPVRRCQRGLDGPQSAGRPAPIGAVTPGKRTTSRRGSTGSVSRSAIRYYSFQVPVSRGRMTGFRQIAECCAPPVPVSSRVRRLSHNNLAGCRFPSHGGDHADRRGWRIPCALAAKLAAAECLRLPGASRAYRLSAMLRPASPRMTDPKTSRSPAA